MHVLRVLSVYMHASLKMAAIPSQSIANSGTVKDITAKDQAQPSPLGRKLQKILDTKLESDAVTLEALTCLSEFFKENSLNNRRNLRGIIEKRSLYHNEEFCRALCVVQSQLEEIHQDVEKMACCHRDMTERLRATQSVTSELIGQTSRLRNETRHLDMKSKVANVFLGRFELTEEEFRNLRGKSGEEINHGFFAALTRVKEIHEDCKQLLRTSQQRLGLEIMERMAMHQEAAFEKLYHWTLSQVHNLSVDVADLPHVVRQALTTLQERPILFSHCVSELSLTRRSSLVQAFIDALTRGGPGGTPRPIELFSHDPLRYVGDMCGWLHQAVASERDFLLGIFGKMGDKIPETLGQITEGICRPLRVRVEQVIVSEMTCVVAFRLSTLLHFYRSTFQDFLADSSPLVISVKELSEFSMRMFLGSLGSYMTKLLDSMEEPPADLTSTHPFREALDLLKEILSNQDISRPEAKELQNDLPQILSASIDPLLQYCNESATKLSAPNMAAYLINCIYILHTALSVYEYTEEWLEKLSGQQSAHMDTLVDLQASQYIVAAGLVTTYKIVNQQKMSEKKLSECKEIKMNELSKSIKHFLSAPDQHRLPQVSLILSPSMRDNLQKLSIDMFINSYEQVFSAVERDDGLDNSLIPTPQSVRELLQ